MILPAAAND